MPTSKTLMPAPYLTLEDIDGDALTGGTVTFLDTGTAILATVYADANGLVISANPLTVDAAGRYSVWLTPYQVVDVEYRDQFGTLIKTVPGVQAIPGAGGNVDIPGILGDGPNIGAWYFLSTGELGVAGQWHLTQSGYPSSQVQTVGVLIASEPSGAATFRIAGKLTGLTGLVTGRVYYLADAYGQVSLTPGLYGRKVGQADTPTSLVLWPNPPPLVDPEMATYHVGGTVLQLVPPADTVLLENNYAGLVVHGIKAGYHGQRVQFINGGTAGQSDFLDNSPSAAAPDRLFNFVGSAPTSLAIGGISRGTLTYVYDVVVPGWRLVAHEQGGWIVPAFTGADYSAVVPAIWVVNSGNVSRCAYYLRGRALQVQLLVTGSNLSGASSTILSRKIPGGYTAGAEIVFGAAASYQLGGAYGLAVWSNTSTTITFRHDLTGGSVWPTGEIWVGADMTIGVD